MALLSASAWGLLPNAVVSAHVRPSCRHSRAPRLATSPSAMPFRNSTQSRPAVSSYTMSAKSSAGSVSVSSIRPAVETRRMPRPGTYTQNAPEAVRPAKAVARWLPESVKVMVLVTVRLARLY